ncbi:hypothetical protein OMAG_000927 [Candidatus Omnitrophus magneticus]|uniref:Uncharacterized protein n=1 Tax=Candidatus Omnitrophus magneticus TaxID=1609969 RepID=A0A0F0CUY2_9BACT|nr:hypothetical protein OMAG_000927 [Candidatus Omnitrophus magneticus]
MKIIQKNITLNEITSMALSIFGNFVKAVVDIEREIIALDAELHSDLEALLLENGSKQKNIWGINIYPDMQGADFIEFDSMINLRPSQGNRSRNVENKEIQKKIIAIVAKRIIA